MTHFGLHVSDNWDAADLFRITCLWKFRRYWTIFDCLSLQIYTLLTNIELLGPEDEITKIFENSETIYPTTNSDFLEDSKFQITHRTKSLRKY